MKKNKRILPILLANNRLKYYKDYILLAKDNGYLITNMVGFYENYKDTKNKYFVLRHDVDSGGKCVRKMFELEKELGVKSTYYFRFCTIDKQLIEEMIESGFEVGLHFESLSDIATEKNVKDMSSIDDNEVKKRLIDDIQRFELIIGHKIHSICSHGARKNTELNVSNNYILENEDIREFGVDFEAYDKTMYDYVDCHIMDGRLLDNYGFAYKDNPINAVEKGYKKIVFLTHPHHWFFSFPRRVRYIVLTLMGKYTKDTKREFSRIWK